MQVRGQKGACRLTCSRSAPRVGLIIVLLSTLGVVYSALAEPNSRGRLVLGVRTGPMLWFRDKSFYISYRPSLGVGAAPVLGIGLTDRVYLSFEAMYSFVPRVRVTRTVPAYDVENGVVRLVGYRRVSSHRHSALTMKAVGVEYKIHSGERSLATISATAGILSAVEKNDQGGTVADGSDVCYSLSLVAQRKWRFESVWVVYGFSFTDAPLAFRGPSIGRRKCLMLFAGFRWYLL